MSSAATRSSASLGRHLVRLARHAVVFELRLYRSLLRWLVRRPDLGGAHDEPFTYARTVSPVMWLWIFASAAELPLVHVLVPWHGVRIALLALGLWGLVWMIGLLASLHVYPHLRSTCTRACGNRDSFTPPRASSWSAS